MSLITTTIGSYPKPPYVPVLDWFRSQEAMSLVDPVKDYNSFLETKDSNSEALLIRGTKEAILDQVNVGIDIPTDGEIRRENYVYYHLEENPNMLFVFVPFACKTSIYRM